MTPFYGWRLAASRLQSQYEEAPGLDLMTRDSYFTILVEVFTNHILAKNTNFTNHRMNRTWNSVFKTCKQVPNYLALSKFQTHYQQFPASVSLSSKHFVNVTFYEAENKQITKTRLFTMQIFMYYLIYLGTRKVFRKIMQHMFFSKISRYIKMYVPWPPQPPTLFYIE